MAEELQKYKDILKREWEEVQETTRERGKCLKNPFLFNKK